MERHGKIVFYDGLCPLCNRIIKLILKWDKEKLFYFASLQSAYARNNIPEDIIENTDSVILMNENDYSIRSEAAFNILKEIGGPWKILLVFSLLPRRVNDFFYDLIARSRYKTFGRLNACPLPPAGDKHRFLDQPYLEN